MDNAKPSTAPFEANPDGKVEAEPHCMTDRHHASVMAELRYLHRIRFEQEQEA